MVSTDSVKDHSFLFVIVGCTLIFIVFLLLSGPHIYGDENLYIECGEKMLINGLAPWDCNFEHPPLAKYIIGLFFLAGFPVVLNIVLFWATVAGLYYIFSSVSKEVALFSILLLSVDTLFLDVYRHYLLDAPALTFAILSLCCFIRWFKKSEVATRTSHIHIVLAGLLAGAALACKWQTVFILTIIPLFIFWKLIKALVLKEKSIGTIILSFTLFMLALMTLYFFAFIFDGLNYGFFKMITHNIDMFSYMSTRHTLSLPIFLIGFLKLLIKSELWNYVADITIIVKTTTLNQSIPFLELVNSTTINVSKRYVVLYVGVGGILWYTFVPSLLIYLWKGLTSGLQRSRFILLAITLASLANILFGPLDWYFIYLIPFMYFIITDLVLTSVKYGRKMIMLLVLIQGVQFLLVVLDLIPRIITLII